MSGTICSNCGSPIGEGQRFCMRCGSPRPQNAQPMGNAGPTPQNAQPMGNAGPRPQNAQPMGNAGPTPQNAQFMGNVGPRPQNAQPSENSILQRGEIIDEKLYDNFLPAFVQSLLVILGVFLLPFNLWTKSISRLAHYKEKKTLVLSNINSPWPFLIFLKRLVCDFMLDFLTFFIYILGVLFALYVLIKEGIEACIVVLAIVYSIPVLLAFIRDIVQLSLLPIKKFLSWSKKPAQYMDLSIEKK